jgi:hypothetical protein
MKNDSRRHIWYRQRKKQGFDDRDLWSLDHTIAKFVLPRLIRFKDGVCGHPGNLTMEQWTKILDQMIYSMQAVVDDWSGKWDEWEKEGIQIHERKINKGITLFGKYFRHLWW